MRVLSLAEAKTFDVPKFSLGEVVATPAALDVFSKEFINHCLRRHHGGDWGDCDAHDIEANECCLLNRGRLLSVYKWQGKKMWIISESDRSSTTVLLPSDY